MSKLGASRAAGLAVLLLLLAVAVQPAEANAWRRFVDSFVPESIRGFFGGSPPEPSEVALRELSEADILRLEEPHEGSVAAGAHDLLRLSFPPNGEDFPNIHLSLTVLDDDGDADIYCIPEFLFDATAQTPTSKFSIWKSDHTQGADHIFISRQHELYEESKVGLQEDGETAEAVAFVCSVFGFAAGGTDYILAVDVDYTDRTLVDKEQKAMEQIFDQCCLGSPAACAPWKSTLNEDSSVSMDFCHIPGNVCNPDGNLIRLDLSGIMMDCEFPNAAIAKLTKLEKLELANNQIKGDVSKVLESLRMKTNSLQYVDLKKNALTGSLSADVMGATPVCDLTHKGSLAFLDLANNKIQGSLHDCLFDATSKLKEISLEGNTMEGTLPDISPKSPLQVLRLEGVGLTGTIPENLGLLKGLVMVNLAGNDLEGSIPSTLGSAPSLVSVKLSDNKLGGKVPISLGQGKHLKYVRLGKNALEQFDDAWMTTGSLESSKLVIFDVSNNKLKGDFPVALASAPSLLAIVLQGNKLSGPIPDEPGMFSSTVVLKLAKNKFSGPIPEALGGAGFFSPEARGSSPYLAVFDLSKNMLTGDIPEYLYASNIPEGLWERVRLGGNLFDLPCPLPLNFIHVKDLVCENGESPIDDTPVPVTTAGNLRETQINPFSFSLGTAVAPEAEKSVDGGLDESVDSTEEPEVQAAEQPAEEPSVEDDIEFTQSELASREDDNGDLDLLGQADGESGDFDTATNTVRGDDKEGRSLTKAAKSKGPVVLIAGCFVLTIVAAVVIAMVARKKRKQSKSELVSDVVNMDLEMQNPPEPEESDKDLMLSGAKPSAPL